MSDREDAELPEGWTLAQLNDGLLTSVQTGFACGDNNRTGDGVAHLRPMNIIVDGRITLSDLKYVPAAQARTDDRLLRKGDVLFNNTNSPALVGKTALYDLPEPRAFSNHMTRLRCQPELLDSAFCALALHSKWQSGYFQAICNNHIGQSSVATGLLQRTTIPLPPLVEQRRIVEKVEALLNQVDAARARLAAVPGILKRFRQAVLSMACSGRLTAAWRAASSADGHALARQASEPRRLNPICQELPDGWRWAPLPSLGEFGRGRSRHRPRNAPHLYGGKYPFIQTGDIARSRGRITAHDQTYSEAGLSQSKLWPAKTVCITIAANIADSAMLTYPACFPDSVVGLTVDKNKCVPEYVEYFIRTARNDLSQFAPATAQKNINVAILSSVRIPLPPIAEQQEIVSRVDVLFALADHVEQRVASATGRAERLTQAILNKAFRGELVPQDPADEPAEALLRRTCSQTSATKDAKTKARVKKL